MCNIQSAQNDNQSTKPYSIIKIQRLLNPLRWLVLSLIFSMLVLLPVVSVYQNYTAAHAYDLLTPEQKLFYDIVEYSTAWFTDDPETDLDAIKGSTWSANFFGYKISDPLAVVGQFTASNLIYWPFVLSALIPILVTMLLGRVFCGWICPANFIYELNDQFRQWLERYQIPVGKLKVNLKLKYGVLLTGLIISSLAGTVLVAAIYPPAVVGRELYYMVAFGSFGSGAAFFLITLLMDLFVARRGFCRYLCPGGALYSLLGRYRLIRIKRKVETCNDCTKCNKVCQFGLDPMHDGFGQECNNCTACIAICPTSALQLALINRDGPFQGPGQLGRKYRNAQQAPTKEEQAA